MNNTSTQEGIEMNLSPAYLIGLFLSPITFMSSSSWLIMWVSIEINNLSFTMIGANNNNWNNDGMLNYFIIQAVASSVIIIASLANTNISATNVTETIVLTAVILNIAAAPIHQWIVEIMKNIENTPATIAITWQNTIPTVIAHTTNNNAIVAFCVTTGIIGAISQSNTNIFINIIALSSVFHNSWLILAAGTNISSIASFIVVYWSTVVIVIESTTKNNTLNLNNKNQWEYISTIINLGGIPPTAGFAANAFILITAVNKNIMSITIVLTTITTINLFAYTKNTINFLTNNNQNNKASPSNNTQAVVTTSLIANITIFSYKLT